MDIKPCKCCGTVPKPRAWYRDGSLWIIACELYACNSTWQIIGDSLDSTVKAWNKLQEEKE